jgi:HAE1 family hydrophobic/amphiphilic exporter-1
MTLNPEASVARALDLRPELRESRLTTQNAQIQYRYARNQVLPRLDAIVNYGAAGVGGTPVTTTDPFTGQPLNISSSAYPHALGQVLRQDFPSWTVGFQVGIPVLNIGARAEAKRSELEVDRTRALEAQTEQSIALDVRTNVRAIDTAAKEIGATRTAREAAEQNLDAERKRYENGMTTIFQVLQIQQQLSDARARELQALVGYNKAVSSYHRAVGDLLDVRNIQIEQEKVEEPRILSFFDKYSFLNFDKPSNSAGSTKTPQEQQK